MYGQGKTLLHIFGEIHVLYHHFEHRVKVHGKNTQGVPWPLKDLARQEYRHMYLYYIREGRVQWMDIPHSPHVV